MQTNLRPSSLSIASFVAQAQAEPALKTVFDELFPQYERLGEWQIRYLTNFPFRDKLAEDPARKRDSACREDAHAQRKAPIPKCSGQTREAD